MPRRVNHRQRAEIQLDALLNEPEASLPTYVRRASSNLDGEEISVKDASKLLNTQPFIIERLMKALYSMSSESNADTETLNRGDIQRLTRVLNSSFDVRALLFFMILDDDGDQYVTKGELTHFYEKYLTDLKTFDNERMQEVISVLLQKFRLEQVRTRLAFLTYSYFLQRARLDYEEFYTIVTKDSTLLETLSQFTVHPAWYIQTTTPVPEKNALQRFFSNLCWQQTIYENQKDKLTIDYLRDNLSRVLVLLLYILVNIALALYVIIYRVVTLKAHVLIVFARIGGMLLNFNCALIIVLMLKQTILLIRTNKLLRKLIPVDDYIDFHRLVGRVIAGLAVMHTIAHMANFGRLDGTTYILELLKHARGLLIFSLFRLFMGHFHGTFIAEDVETLFPTVVILWSSSPQNRILDGSMVLLLWVELFSVSFWRSWWSSPCNGFVGVAISK